MEGAVDLTNISPRQGRLRQAVGWTLTIAGVIAGVLLALDDSGLLVPTLPIAAIVWGTSWIFGGRAQICAVDATRGREHPTELLSFGVGGLRVAQDDRVDAIRHVARRATIRATAVAIVLSLPILLL